jgi:uncharacterized protein involved in oxidation of intracellular sulfur
MSDKKLVVIVTHAFEDPERATIPFVMANAALASETDVTVILQTTGVMLAVKDRAKHVRAESFPALHELVKIFSESGGKLMACAPCLKSRGITEEELIEGTRIVAAATVVAETTSADATLIY